MPDSTQDIAIRVENVSKAFKLPHEKQSSLKGVFLSSFRSKSYELQQSLKNVSFEVKKGEFFGIVGRNGSGKSTLLKCMAGVYTPDKGKIKIYGSLVPFIELGVGFNPELSGRDNVFLNAALLGFSRKQTEAMYHDIVEFAELEKFMDQKLKNYSSGMQVRLAFSIAIRAKSDILLLDEVLAVGDSAFQQKCFDYFASLKNENRTIILVSHAMAMIERFCDRALLLEYGEIKEIGTSTKIAGRYEEMFLREEADRLSQQRGEEADGTETVELVKARVIQGGKAQGAIEADEDFEIEVTVKSKIAIDHVNIGINVKNHDKLMLISADTALWAGQYRLEADKEMTARFKIQNIFANGVYTINLGVADDSPLNPHLLLRRDNIHEFIIKGVSAHVQTLTRPKIQVTVT
ncbi:MAG TPA: ABC transporter ATP-binding protein [Candidatus Limnocylindria bacterium]|nr:ABC transporter ATP-binding protein [Candidatus Limnocylindria bacterium]